MKPLKIALIGSRGIPNSYGGFEELAQWLAEGLLRSGHQITVYNSHRHPYQKSEWRGIQIIHCYDAEHLLGVPGQFIYDWNCIRNARRKKFDVIVFLGYTSSSVWGKFFPRDALIISNMDGLEWKRDKYSLPVKRFLQYAEKLAVKYSDFLVADAESIARYLKDKFNKDSMYIPYGAVTGAVINEQLLDAMDLQRDKYFMLMARMEPENNIEMILEGFHKSKAVQKFIVIGSVNNSFGRKMRKKFESDKRIYFAGAIYDDIIKHTLRTFCNLYFHGHSVGGTNPSLLEAMADGAAIAAHDNEFNREVLGADAYYFRSAADIKQFVESATEDNTHSGMTANNKKKITGKYNWPAIVKQYDEYITGCYNQIQK